MKNNPQKFNTNYDVVIVGGGLVGASLALGLTQLSLKVALIDPACGQPIPKEVDGRTIALSITSCKILEALCFGFMREEAKLNHKLLDELQIAPIKTVHISEQNRFAITRLKASDSGLPALGYSVEIDIMMAFLYGELKKTDCDLIPTKVKDAKRYLEGFEIQLENTSITTKLLIGADGDHSFLRELLNIPVTIHDYGQTALVTTVEITGNHFDTAFERFISYGSIALLPIAEKKMKLIWVAATETIKMLTRLSSESLLNKLQEHMGRRLGTFHTLGSHFIYPLKFQHVSSQVQKAFVLMGNAAHTLHPIAAQGFNLSLRDNAIFIEAIRQALVDQQEIGAEQVLQGYLAKRVSDQKHTENLTHYLANGVTRDLWLERKMRSIAFNIFECFPAIKKRFTQFAMGSCAALPRWVYLTDE